MRVLVTGGRTYHEWRPFARAMDSLDGVAVVIQGGANGADQMARKWAATRNVSSVTYEANWLRGKKAGPERNAFMLADSRPDLVMAFPGSRGTADMVARAKAAGIEVREIA